MGRGHGIQEAAETVRALGPRDGRISIRMMAMDIHEVVSFSVTASRMIQIAVEGRLTEGAVLLSEASKRLLLREEPWRRLQRLGWDHPACADIGQRRRPQNGIRLRSHIHVVIALRSSSSRIPNAADGPHAAVVWLIASQISAAVDAAVADAVAVVAIHVDHVAPQVSIVSLLRVALGGVFFVLHPRLHDAAADSPVRTEVQQIPLHAVGPLELRV